MADTGPPKSLLELLNAAAARSPQVTNQGPTLIRINQVAELLGVSSRSIYRRVKAGDMPPPVKIGHLTRWRVNEIQDWCADGCPPLKSSQGGAQ